MIQNLAKELQAQLGADVGVYGTVISAHSLWPEEEPSIARATSARRNEFSTGRYCARKAMRVLGLSQEALPMGADRAPIWPQQMGGSISHAKGYAMSAVVRTENCAGLGIDLEQDAALGTDIRAEVIHPDDCQKTNLSHVVFSAKETTYKAFYPIIREVWSFDAVSIFVASDGCSFVATLNRNAGPWVRGSEVTGIILRKNGLIATALRLPIVAI